MATGRAGGRGHDFGSRSVLRHDLIDFAPALALRHRYLPARFGNLHPRFRTPYVAMLAGAVVSTLFLLLMFSGETLRSGFDSLYDATILANAVPFLVMYAAGWKLGYRISGALGFAVSLSAAAFSLVPTSAIGSTWVFEAKCTGLLLLIAGSGWVLFQRGRRKAARCVEEKIRPG